MKPLKKLLLSALILICFQAYAQEKDNDVSSNIQTYTPSKLLNKGQWDIKWFNNLYTQTKEDQNGSTVNFPRQNFFTSTLEVFTGVSDNSTFNVGLLLELRSNTIGGRGAFDVFQFDGETGTARSGLASFAPAIKFNPIKNVGNFTIQTAFHIPLIEDQSINGVFLDQTSFTFQNRFFYDYTFPSKKWQLFTELNTEYDFGDENSFANKTLLLVPGVFLSYFPSNESTVLVFTQHAQRFGDFTQNYTALGLGGKYQISRVLNIEALYSNFVRGTDNGLGQSFNIGLRALF